MALPCAPKARLLWPHFSERLVADLEREEQTMKQNVVASGSVLTVLPVALRCGERVLGSSLMCATME